MTTQKPDGGPAQVEYRDVPCEGCHVVGRGRMGGRGRYPARFPKMPDGWCQSGRSRKVPGASASWCPRCESKVWLYDNPSPRDVKAMLAERAK